MTAVRLFLFGTPHVKVNEKSIVMPRKKALALLAFLATDERIHSRETVAALLWPNLSETAARNGLRAVLPLLTRLSDQSCVRVDRSTLSLATEVVWSDVQTFLQLVAQVRMHAHDGAVLCAACAAALEQAAALYADDFLTGFSLPDSAEFDNWQTTRQEWLHQEYTQVLRRLAEYHAATNAVDALDYARRWLSVSPTNEDAHRFLMRLYLRDNQRSEALKQYRECVRILDEAFASPPQDETRQLYEMIRGAEQATDRVIAPAAAGHGGVYVLPPAPNLLIGREAELAELKSRLIDSDGTHAAMTIIEGWPGVGKSTTLAALARDPDMTAAFPDGILWTSLGEKPNIASELSRWSEAVQGMPGGKNIEVRHLTQQISAALREKRVLLLIDDVWDTEHLMPFRVEGNRCAAVITTRLSNVARSLSPTAADIYRLPQLTSESALSLLYRLAPEVVAKYRATAIELVERLEGLPLAIQVAGRLLHQEAQMGWGIDALMTELREGSRLLGEQLPSDVRTVMSDSNATVAALLNRSTRTLDRQTVERFALLSLFVPKPATFDLSAMAALWQTDDARPTVRVLVDRGLLEPLSGGRFQMHALLILHARSLLNAAQSARQ